MSEAVIPPISPRRRRTDKVMRRVMGAGTLVALVPLVLILYYLFIKAFDAWSVDFFTTDPTGNFLGNPGGVKSAILGTIEIVALATAMAVPIGIGVALYLTEYGGTSRFASVVRYFVDVMTGVPSIVFGLFIYIVLVLSGALGSGFAGWKGAAALALLMLPVITRAAEVVLTLVPDALREGALALGAPRWRVVVPDRAADRAAGADHGHPAGDRARGRGDRAAALHGDDRERDDVQPQRSDELASGPDLRRRGRGAEQPAGPRLGRRHDPRRHDPRPHHRGAYCVAKEPSDMTQEPETEMTDSPPTTGTGGTGEEGTRDASSAPATGTADGGPAAAADSNARRVRLESLDAFYGDNHAVKEASLDFPPNEVTAIIGPSGCGKSTLVRCINRMHEEIPGARAGGRVMLDDLDVYDPTVDVVAVRRAIGMVFQKPNPFPTMSIFDNVAAGPRLAGVRGGAMDERVERTLRGAGLWEEVKDRLHEPGIGLSGGQQQRLCIARTLAVEPEVILMDEPCSALDPVATLKIEELIGELRRRYTIVIVTHNMQQAGRVADSTAFMLNGEMVEHGPTDKIFTTPDDERTEDYVTGKFG